MVGGTSNTASGELKTPSSQRNLRTGMIRGHGDEHKRGFNSIDKEVGDQTMLKRSEHQEDGAK
jgi:hypothetical protein